MKRVEEEKGIISGSNTTTEKNTIVEKDSVPGIKSDESRSLVSYAHKDTSYRKIVKLTVQPTIKPIDVYCLIEYPKTYSENLGGGLTEKYTHPSLVKVSSIFSDLEPSSDAPSLGVSGEIEDSTAS